MDRQFSDLIILLASGINQRVMYFDRHPKVQSLGREFLKQLQILLETTDLQEFSFGVFNGKFIRNGKYLVGPSIAGRSLIRFAERLGCGGFTFTLPLAESDLVTFFRLAAELNEEVGSLENARRLLRSNGLDKIGLLVPFAEEGTESKDGPSVEGKEPATAESGQPEFLAAEFAPLLEIYQALYDTVSGNTLAANGDTKIDLDQARARGQELVAVSDQGALDVMQFMRYPDYDSYTIGHSVRVAALAALVGRELGWTSEQRAEVATAGLLHDLGKGRIPEEILFKPGKLDPDERGIMETHPVLGVKILLANGEKSSIVISAAWGHHIRHDGGGYPGMNRDYANSIASSLIHVCDVFEALTAARPYKAPLPPRRSYEIMLADKGAFHPRLLAALVRSMGLYPPGSEVLLSDFRRAVVVAGGPDLKNPLVRVTHESGGLPLPRVDQPSIQLAAGREPTVREFLTVGIRDEDENAGRLEFLGSLNRPGS